MKIIVYINFILTSLLIGVVAWILLFQKPNKVVVERNSPNQLSNSTVSYVDKCGDECKKIIEDSVNNALLKVQETPKEVAKATATTPAAPTLAPKSQVAYIPISGTATTTSASWYDVPNTDFYLDIEKNYSKNYVANWNASLKVAHGNGTAYARLFDVTHGIAVNGSELKLTDNSNLTQVFSGNLSFWSGNNLYRVQFKSLNTFEITFGGGQIKINY